MGLKTVVALAYLIKAAADVAEAVDNGAYSGSQEDIDLLVALRDAVEATARDAAEQADA